MSADICANRLTANTRIYRLTVISASSVSWTLQTLRAGSVCCCPALTRIQPRLIVLAALGCVLLQIAAMIFHLSRGEAPAVPLNIILLALSVFILWGRGKRAPISPRG